MVLFEGKRSALADMPSKRISDASVLFADDQIEITFQQGNNQKAVVAFAGVGFGLGGIQIEEFRKSLSGNNNSILFVKDKSRHWFNSSFEETLNIINGKLVGMTEVFTIGNSMGGFAAIAFASRLKNCKAVLAFAAQSTVDPSIVPWETRYKQFTDSITKWNGLDAMKLISSDVNYVLVYGDENILDNRHAQRFISSNDDTVSVYIVRNSGHDVASYLKKLGRLQPLIDEVIFEQMKCVNRGRALSDLPMQLEVPRKDCR